MREVVRVKKLRMAEDTHREVQLHCNNETRCISNNGSIRHKSQIRKLMRQTGTKITA